MQTVEKPPNKMYKLLGVQGFYWSEKPGLLGGHSRQKIYGRLDCRTALVAISRGGYVKHRVFFADQQIAIQCGYRPCAICMPDEYKLWRLSNKARAGR